MPEASASASGRLLSSGRWSSIEYEPFDIAFEPLPPRFSKSVDFHLAIADKKHFKGCIFVSILLLALVVLLFLLLHIFIHSNQNTGGSKNLTLALSQALLFFDAQKSGNLTTDVRIKFRGDSGLNDGKDENTNADLVGGFYDSGNNIKFTFSTAYTVTLLSWTVVEYHQKYVEIGELDHIMDIIKWGSDYLLKTFIPPSADSNSTILYSQVGGNSTNQETDMTCWQRPEDMKYPRLVSICNDTAADLAGEVIAGLSAASLVFAENVDYSKRLLEAGETLFNFVTRKDDPSRQNVMYTENDACGGQARSFYKSSGYMDELVWAGTWLFFATGNTSYIKYATDNFGAAEEEELNSERGVFYWNNKLTANAILMTRIRYFIDLGYPYEDALSTNRTDLLMCSYLSNKLTMTKGGLVLIKPDTSALLQYTATAAFLSKLYSDYLQLLSIDGVNCDTYILSTEKLKDFAMSQVSYILGDNPESMSYMVGYSKHYPNYVHHRGASIPWDGKSHSCSEGDKILHSKDKNPNVLLGAMVGGPDANDYFLDERDKPEFTEPSISSNAGLVAALIALHDPPAKSANSDLGIDKMGMFQNVQFFPTFP